MKDFDKRTQRFKYMPTSFATWEKIIGQLGKKAEKRINTLRPGVKRQRFAGVLQRCLGRHKICERCVEKPCNAHPQNF